MVVVGIDYCVLGFWLRWIVILVVSFGCMFVLLELIFVMVMVDWVCWLMVWVMWIRWLCVLWVGSLIEVFIVSVERCDVGI